MVAGHLQEKKGYFYMVLTYKDHEGKRKSKWITTGLTVKGNKKRAQDLLQEAKKTLFLISLFLRRICFFMISLSSGWRLPRARSN